MRSEQMRTGIFHAGCCALLMEMGCGKTVTAIAVADFLRAQHVLHSVLIIAPLSILPVWEDDLRSLPNFCISHIRLMKELEGVT